MLKRNHLSVLIGVIFSILFLTDSTAQDVANGGLLFRENSCIACHKIATRLVGPPLKGVSDRRTTEWLHSFITNSTALIKTDADAEAIFEEYSYIPMPSYQLSTEEIDDILAYIKAESIKDVESVETIEDIDLKQVDEIESEKPDTWWKAFISFIFGSKTN